MNKRIKKKLSRRGGYKVYKNWNSWTKMKHWANLYYDYDTHMRCSARNSIINKDIPSVFWRNYNEQTTTQETS